MGARRFTNSSCHCFRIVGAKKICFILIQVEVQFEREQIHLSRVSIVQYEMTGLSDFYLWNVTQQIANHTF